MRTCDIDTSADTWVYRPQRHKTEHHDAVREIWIGPKARDILTPWLRMNVGEWLFSPLRARERMWAEKRTLRKTRVQPSQFNRKKRAAERQRRWRDVYDVDSYRNAIDQALERLNAQQRTE